MSVSPLAVLCYRADLEPGKIPQLPRKKHGFQLRLRPKLVVRPGSALQNGGTIFSAIRSHPSDPVRFKLATTRIFVLIGNEQHPPASEGEPGPQLHFDGPLSTAVPLESQNLPPFHKAAALPDSVLANLYAAEPHY